MNTSRELDEKADLLRAISDFSKGVAKDGQWDGGWKRRRGGGGEGNVAKWQKSAMRWQMRPIE